MPSRVGTPASIKPGRPLLVGDAPQIAVLAEAIGCALRSGIDDPHALVELLVRRAELGGLSGTLGWLALQQLMRLAEDGGLVSLAGLPPFGLDLNYTRGDRILVASESQPVHVDFRVSV